MDPESLKLSHKQFNKPEEYKSILNLLARHNVYAITSFIYGMEGDTPNVARETVQQMKDWPPGLPVFGLLTPYPGTPLYARLQKEKRLTRPEHWLDFQAFKTAFIPKGISAEEAEAQVRQSWLHCYSPATFFRAQRWMVEQRKAFGQQLTLFITRLLFRGIYFPQRTRWSWLRLLALNSRTVTSLIHSGLQAYRESRNLRQHSPPKTTTETFDSFELDLDLEGDS
jgi:hypothetical protein